MVVQLLRRRPIFARLIIVAGAALLATAAVPAYAAVRHCAARIDVAADDRTELAARRKALQQWIAAARAVGETFTRWQLASARSLSCAPIAGGFRCRASAAPCTIAQQPNPVPHELLPKETPPKKKGLDA
jgi:hypothetical protein